MRGRPRAPRFDRPRLPVRRSFRPHQRTVGRKLRRARIADRRHPRDVAAGDRHDAEPPFGRAAGDDAVAVADDAHAVAVERQEPGISGQARRRSRRERDPLPSRENTGFDAVIGVRPVTGRCVLSLERRHPDLAAARERDRLAIARQREVAGVGEAARHPRRLRAAGDTVHSTPSFENRISVGETQANDVTSEVRMSGSTGKSVSAIGFRPGVDDEQILLAPRVPQKRDHLAVGRPRRRRRIFDLRDAIDGDAAAGRVRQRRRRRRSNSRQGRRCTRLASFMAAIIDSAAALRLLSLNGLGDDGAETIAPTIAPPWPNSTCDRHGVFAEQAQPGVRDQTAAETIQARRPAPAAAAARARRETPRQSAPGSPRSPRHGNSRCLPRASWPGAGPMSKADAVTPSSDERNRQADRDDRRDDRAARQAAARNRFAQRRADDDQAGERLAERKAPRLDEPDRLHVRHGRSAAPAPKARSRRRAGSAPARGRTAAAAAASASGRAQSASRRSCRARSFQVLPHLPHAAKRARLRGVDANPEPRGDLDEAPAFDVVHQQRLR